MPYARYGKIFRQLRNQKKLSLSYFENASIGLTKSTLGRFERGETMISFDKLDIALQEMNVTLAEYEYFVNDFMLDFQEEILLEIEYADFNRNTSQLNEIYQEAKNTGYLLLAYAAKSCFSILNSEEQEEITEYLYGIEKWGYFEITLLYFTISRLSNKEIHHLMKNFWEKNENILGIFRYRRRILQTSYRAVGTLCLRGDRIGASRILNQSNQQNKERDFFISTLRIFISSLYAFQFENKQEGLTSGKRALSLLSDLGDEILKNYYSQHYSDYTSKM